MADQGCINLRAAHALLAGLIQGGMRDLVLSPGSRSTPLVLAAQAHDLRMFPILDERSAAFFALGLARAARRPVGVLCTSGSALGHWYPAVIEADCSGAPLILLSADRPPELRHWGANQTIDQTRFFGVHVRAFYDPGPPDELPGVGKYLRALGRRAAAECQGLDPGPVHLNLPFRESLVPGPDCRLSPSEDPPLIPAATWPNDEGAQAQYPRIDQDVSPYPFIGDDIHLNLGDLGQLGRRGLICCGPGEWTKSGSAALWRLAERLRLPVLCDPLSGLRFGPGSDAGIVRYDALLRYPELAQGLKPDWVIRFGRAPVSKRLNDWLTGVPTLLVEPGRRFSDPTHDVPLKIQADPGRFCAWAMTTDACPIQADEGWLEGWNEVEQRLERLMADYLSQAPWCEGHLVRTLIACLPAGEGLLCANSLPIRQLDLWSGSRRLPLHVFGNRGASGIDGQASTLAGFNASGLPTTGLLGDLSLWHDLSGLLQLRGCPRPCIVINNGGGRIFDTLPQRNLPSLERFWRCPIPLALGPLTQAFGLSHWEVADGTELVQALTEAQGVQGVLIEVRVDAELSLEVHRGLEKVLQSTHP
ncbi:2-succinyl-5-enolpyruvyl-6-hydroxy-3-cyclohexene-1-carboxylic-acid synthase [Caldichromatium japonicum]|uniref:2-succinyl-5-enolpyruvyl-6-hydroxy-3-cyclohexene-1-carboxylate synthase n=1 Tax=Caldichromatium japonicum TaxID=2699430 RepID=A0A6G7VCJ9_9GAMM|nr:2-succinyl-5-enolpyruvyl-6-hydroxy-3-cyclohexene-1-carboxylic-acid synthase [Caldichromatium japonicum]QIK37694.1 2-succinyl-5-enolpyruvyl-6-hydroxy-3-cyclohexene-1-carboxylic-acid synthase [Caldichromatium japonicum]